VVSARNREWASADLPLVMEHFPLVDVARGLPNIGGAGALGGDMYSFTSGAEDLGGGV